MRHVSLTLMLAAIIAALTLPLAAQNMQPSGTARNIVVDTVQVSAKVIDVNQANRTVTLQMPNGRTTTYKVSRDVKGFSQVKKGDTIKGTLLNAMAVSIDKAGARPTASETQAVTLAPRGMPGIVMTDTVRITGKIQSIDMGNRTVTIVGPTGTSHTFKVGANVTNLRSLRTGDNIVLRHTQALAISLQKPNK